MTSIVAKCTKCGRVLLELIDSEMWMQDVTLRCCGQDVLIVTVPDGDCNNQPTSV